jgi:hypothetical protein
MIFLALLTALGLGLSSVFSALPLILNGEGSTSFVPLGCAEFGPFGTLSTCFILCSNSICSNAFDICMERMFPECDAIIRYDAHLDYVSPLTSQLVQLVSLNASIDAVKAINYEKCFDLGKRLSRSPFVQSVTQWDEERKRAYDRYTKKLTAILYLHFRKNGGTTMCRLAQLNGLRVPPVEGHLSLFESSMGKNCNPATFQMKAWFGSKKEQLQYIKSFGIQFFGSEVNLTPVFNVISHLFTLFYFVYDCRSIYRALQIYPSGTSSLQRH